jgi:aryl-alcohol dehydrogenase-like predicted oxidoreductase
VGGLAVEYRNLGRSGLLVSLVGLGCDNFGHRCDPAQSTAIVQRAIDLGITLFDTADIYGPEGLSEEYLGKALSGRRHDAVIATKFVGPTAPLFGPGLLHMGTSRRHIMNAIEASLRRLGTDYIDLYQIHFPFPGVPMEETLRTLDDLVHQGKVRYIGCSNFAAWQIVDANWIARTQQLEPFISAQNSYNLLDRQIERELMPACAEHGVGILPYFPLASGFLTGKYRPGQQRPKEARLAGEGPKTDSLTGVDDALVRQTNPELVRWVTPETIFTEPNYDILAKLEAFAEARGHTILDLAIGWLAGQPGVASVLVGASRPEQIEQNARGAEWALSPEELAEVAGITSSCLYLQPVPPTI